MAGVYTLPGPPGRKTGLPRTVALPWFPHPDGYMVVASFAGSPKNPAWYENLVASPDVEVQVKARRFRAEAGGPRRAAGALGARPR